MPLPPQSRLVRFGVFEFDPASGDLWRAGRRIRMQNQPRQVLKRLVARPGELVRRDELRRELWPDDTFVDFDNGLNVAIRKIRESLGDVAPSPRFIETERAQGYRFIAPVIAPDAGPDAAPAARLTTASGARAFRTAVWRRPSITVPVGALLLVVIAAATTWVSRQRQPAATASQDAPGPVSLAVLPLAYGSEAGDELLATGIADGIVTRLSNVRQFRVRPSTASARFQRAGVDAQAAGQALECQYVLAGTIRTTADHVRVRVQLVETSSGSSLWGDQYDVERGDLLRVEDSIAEGIARALRVEVSEAERARLVRRYTRSGAAYERYLMGRARLRLLTEDAARLAIAEFEAARDLDPAFAPAYAGIATAAAQLRVRFTSTRDAASWDARARQEAGRALELDPDLAEAHVALAAVHRFQEYDWNTVIRESRRATELNPSLDLPHFYLAAAYFHLGLLDEARTAIAKARQLNPEVKAEPLEIAGATDLYAGRTEDAVRNLSQAAELGDSRIARYMLAWAIANQGDRPRAEAMLHAMARDEGPVAGNARATLAALLASRGARDDARALAERVSTEHDVLHHAAYGLGTAYAQLRDPDAAVRWLSRAAATGFPCYPWYERDPLLEPIRQEARFVAFMRDLRLVWQDARAKYASDASAPIGW